MYSAYVCNIPVHNLMARNASISWAAHFARLAVSSEVLWQWKISLGKIVCNYGGEWTVAYCIHDYKVYILYL